MTRDVSSGLAGVPAGVVRLFHPVRVIPGMRRLHTPLRADGSGANRCDFCQSPIPLDPRRLTYEGTEYVFCTEACKTAMLDRERVFTKYRGHRWLRTGISGLDAKLPQGLHRNSMVLLSAQPGARETAFQAELVWRALQRDEPAVFVAFNDPPVSVVERFLSLEWNVLPYLESGDMHILDCFTYRVDDRDRLLDRMSRWTSHLYSIAEPEITSVRDPTNISELENRIDDCTNGRGMVDTGIVVIDSLTEFGSLVQPVRAYDFVKDTRADICKGRFIPVFAGAAYTGDSEQFPHDLEYLFDGIIDLELNHQIIEDSLIKRLRIRKMNGALAYPQWSAYEYTSEQGLVTFDPREELDDDDPSNADQSSTSNPSDGST